MGAPSGHTRRSPISGAVTARNQITTVKRVVARTRNYDHVTTNSTRDTIGKPWSFCLFSPPPTHTICCVLTINKYFDDSAETSETRGKYKLKR